MTYNTRVVIVAAIFLVAVLFLASAPVYAKSSGTPFGTETATTIMNYQDLTSKIVNPSFESNVVTDGNSVAGATGWTTQSGGSFYTWNPSSAMITGAGGNVLPVPTLPSGNNGTGSGTGTSTCLPAQYTLAADGSQIVATFRTAQLQQTVDSLSTAANQTYVMTWEFGSPGNYSDGWGYTVGMVYGTNSWFMLINNDTSFDTTHTYGGHNAAAGAVFNQFSYSFATGTNASIIGKGLTIRFGGGTTNTNSTFNLYDNVHLYGYGAGITAGTLVTPEPSTMALIVTGAIGMLAYAWRRKRKK